MKKLLLILIIIFTFFALNYFSQRHITAVFSDIRPFDNNITVFYKGISVGKVKRSSLSKDFQKTNLEISLHNKKLQLPLNTKAILKKRVKNDKEIDYIELIYPQIPSERFIGNHSHIHGYSTVDAKEYLKNQNPEDLDKIKTNLMTASENLYITLDAIGGMFVLIQDILQENRSNIKSSSTNFKETTKNINNLTKKIDNIIVEEQWNNTFNNIENSSSGLNLFTKNINSTITNADKTLTNTLENTNQITKNLNSITCGIRKTLCKKLGGLRLFFGKVID